MCTLYKIISREFPVTVAAADDYSTKFLALYLISAEMAFSVDCVNKERCTFMILIPAVDEALETFLRYPPLSNPVSNGNIQCLPYRACPASPKTDLSMSVIGTGPAEQLAAFIADAWKMMLMVAEPIVYR